VILLRIGITYLYLSPLPCQPILLISTQEAQKVKYRIFRFKREDGR